MLNRLMREKKLLEAQLRDANNLADQWAQRNIALEAECERLRQFQIAYNDWQAKTDWVQESAKPNELGRHRADVLRARIEALAAELAAIKRQGDVVEVAQVVSYLSACADGYDPDAPHPGPPEPLMTVAQHNRILAASVPAGCKAVPVDLIERTICRLTHGHEHDKAVRELRALLVSAEGGEV